MTQQLVYAEAFHDLRELYRGGTSKAGSRGDPQRADIASWSTLGGMDEPAVFDAVADGLVRDYADEILTWQFCDDAANKLFHVLLDCAFTDAGVAHPERFWAFYLAFDDSETAPSLAESIAIANANISKYLRDFSG